MLNREESTLQKAVEIYFSKHCFLMDSLEYLGSIFNVQLLNTTTKYC